MRKYLELEKRAPWRSLLIALCCEIDDFSAVVYTKKNVAAKALPTKSATFQTAWLGRLRVTTTSSAAGATACIAVIIQTECGFLSGGRREASADNREDCYGRATVALTRAIQHTFIVSPLDMSGMIGMAQTLAVYHYGYYTLKAGQIQSHEPAFVPSDAAAVLDWGLDIPFTNHRLTSPPLPLS